MDFGPAGGVHPVSDEPFGQVFIGFVALSRLFVRLAGATESFGEALGEIRRAQPPTATEGVPLARGFALAGVSATR